MAKGRKVGWSHQERWLVSDNTSQTEGPDGIELGEEDVWSMIDGALDRHDDPMLHGTQTPDWPDSHVDAMIRNQRLMSHDGARVGGLSLAFEDPSRTGAARIVHQFHTQENPKPSQRGRHVAASAPVRVPTWSRIGRVESAESLNEWDGGSTLSQEDELEKVPPHEYLAREHARSQKNLVATSVFEGVGRTLKGRDASRVRDAVWSRTGFNG
ncbi:hypothetical protein Syun_010082 [Stephania yunnanensis]|uniref:Uncharacterized protein n=1 Tax=Stephania yunnanensis TaxID=152371 RepID=A0AAP0KHH1_9MAGN